MKIRLLALALCSVVTCDAQTLDQNYSPASYDVSYGVSGLHSRAQTFTVGIDGTLNRIDVWFQGVSGSAEIIYIDLRGTTAGVPLASDTAVLLGGSFTSNSGYSPVNSFYVFDVSSLGLGVSSGDVFAVTLHGGTANTGGSMRGRTDGSYAGGGAFDGVSDGTNTTWAALSGIDFGIRTYVVAAIPEPSATVLLAGMLALGAWSWSRRRVGNSQ